MTASILLYCNQVLGLIYHSDISCLHDRQSTRAFQTRLIAKSHGTKADRMSARMGISDQIEN
ncbi:MAG: hypothetical protein KME42_28280 [Tildeniella nuda ZEHNDER 1965/U140]|nr:hypothetical protein [Tildeniella nuda ZEHNDER 1965/U140]